MSKNITRGPTTRPDRLLRKHLAALEVNVKLGEKALQDALEAIGEIREVTGILRPKDGKRPPGQLRAELTDLVREALAETSGPLTPKEIYDATKLEMPTDVNQPRLAVWLQSECRKPGAFVTKIRISPNRVGYTLTDRGVE